MQYVVRIHAENKGGTLSNANGKLSVNNADEVVFFVTADTDYKINFNPDFTNPRTYVGVNPAETTNEWMQKAIEKGYDALYKEHYEDYAALFNRVKLELNPDMKKQQSSYPATTTELSQGTAGLLSGRTLLSVWTLSTYFQFASRKYACQSARHLAQ